MALEKDFELLDSYVGNRMDAAEKAAFEQQLNADPSLQRALNVQQKIVAGIRQARAAELKTMLNNIPVSATYGGEASAITKTLAGLLVAGAVGTGIYFYLQKDVAVEPQAQTNENTVVTEEDEPVTPPAHEPAATPAPSETAPAAANENKASSDNESASPAQTPAAADTQQAQPARDPKINVFDPSEEPSNAKVEQHDVVTAEPEIKSTASKTAYEVVRNNKKYNFHYQFKDGRLILYGSFEKNLYEIMEFFSDNKRTMFLFYKDNYYLLNEADEKIKPLTAIKDPGLLKKLKDSRGN